MKEHLSPEDLRELTVSQKQMLRSMWLPQINDLALASICMNVETDEYDEIEFVVGQILINAGAHSQRIVLRRLRLVDDPEIGGAEDEDGAAGDGADENEPAENADESWNGSSSEYGEEEDFSDEGSPEMMYCEPEQYFMFEDCMPLLSIGQMIGMIRKSRIGQRGLQIFIPPDTDKIFERRLFTAEDSEGEAFENEELCDLLWEAFKTLL